MQFSRGFVLFVSLLIVSGCSSSVDEEPQVGLPKAIAEIEESLLKHEEAIADCMVEAGFEYTAVLPPDWLLQKAAMLDTAAGGTGNIDFEKVEIPPDPNVDYALTLSEEEQRAYDFAYWGDIDQGGLVSGCYNATNDDSWGLETLTEEEWEEGNQRNDEILARRDSDPRVLAALKDYIDCMADRGYEGADVNAVSDLYWHLEEAVYEGTSSMTREELSAFVTGVEQADDDCLGPYIEVENAVHWDIVDVVKSEWDAKK